MTVWLCVTPEREQKTEMMMRALSRGLGNLPHRVIVGEPPEDDHPFVVWGQEWLTMRIVPKAVRSGRPFWCIDNGYWNPARGGARGYYRLTYRGMTPVFLPKSDDLRLAPVPLKPWRRHGKHVLLAMPGVHFGMALGIDVPAWCATIEARLRLVTDRPIRIRLRGSRDSLPRDLDGAWCCVTHSSNVAVDAAIAGIPVFVAPTSAAAPVGRIDLDLANPITPGRKKWLRSLASQQFTIAEMASGEAWRWMARIAEQVDGNRSANDSLIADAFRKGMRVSGARSFHSHSLDFLRD